jgi:acyl-CoA reductase-like NAD-dependent aldehyde dehydrogenase
MTVTPMRIGAERVTTADTTVVTSPYDGREIGRVPTATAEHLDAAVAVALECHRAGALPAWRRAEILDRAAVVLAERFEEFAQLISAEAAKPLKAARVEATRAVDTFRFSAGVARSLAGEVIPMDASSAGTDKVAFTLRVPIGVVGAISPFNFPLNLVAHKLAPAIAAGCPVVLKPASGTPLTALLLAEVLIDDCGLPPGWLNVVTAGGKVAEALVDNDDVAMITFTGSPPVGWGIRGRAPRKKVSLELGNNSPVIVHHDADVEAAARKIGVAGNAFSGQTCISVQRVFVHASVAEQFTAALVDTVSNLVVGDPADPATDVSALITPGETQRVKTWVDEAVEAGAALACGGTLDDNGVLLPTVLTGVTPDMEVCRTEVFGPVLGVATYTDIDDAFALANDTRYGLQAGVFTSNVSLALRAGRTLDYGGVLINEVSGFRADQMPYGGVRDSGNTKEGPAWAAREMTEERLIILAG